MEPHYLKKPLLLWAVKSGAAAALPHVARVGEAVGGAGAVGRAATLRRGRQPDRGSADRVDFHDLAAAHASEEVIPV